MLILAAVLISVVLYPRLPETLPSHWNLRRAARRFRSQAVRALSRPHAHGRSAPSFSSCFPRSPRAASGSNPSVRVWAVLEGSILGAPVLIHALCAHAGDGEAGGRESRRRRGRRTPPRGPRQLHGESHARTSSSASARPGRSRAKRCGCARTGSEEGSSSWPVLVLLVSRLSSAAAGRGHHRDRAWPRSSVVYSYLVYRRVEGFKKESAPPVRVLASRLRRGGSSGSGRQERPRSSGDGQAALLDGLGFR